VLENQHNQDHSMFTAQLTVQNIIDGTHHDVWDINVEEDYHEEHTTETPPRNGSRPANAHSAV